MGNFNYDNWLSDEDGEINKYSYLENNEDELNKEDLSEEYWSWQTI